MQNAEYGRALKLLPLALREIAMGAPDKLSASAEEIRLRMCRPLCVVAQGRETELGTSRSVQQNELQMVLEIATRASAHSYTDSIRRGFVTAQGGVRVGLCGEAITENGAVTGLRRVFSICIRIPRELRGIADAVFGGLTAGSFESTILLAPPGGGKTTLLRELIRLLSDSGERISLIDERHEVSGFFEGRACFDLGAKTDVMTGAGKAEGVLMALRSMSPQTVAFDEITAPEDVRAAVYAANCGVSILTTAHAAGIDDLRRRPLYRPLLDGGVFRRAVVIDNRAGSRSYEVLEL